MHREKRYTWADNIVRELATVCLPWQHWTKVLVWFDDVEYQRFTAVLYEELWVRTVQRDRY